MSAELTMTLDVEALPLADQRALYEQLHYKFQKKSKSTGASIAGEDVWNAIHDALGLDKHNRQPLTAARERIGASKFDRLMSVAQAFVSRGSGVPLRRNERHFLLAASLTCLADYLTAVGSRVTPTTMVQQLDNLAYAVERDYPGYADAKLLHKIVALR